MLYLPHYSKSNKWLLWIGLEMKLENALYMTTVRIRVRFCVMVLQSYLAYLWCQAAVSVQWPLEPLSSLVRCRWCDFVVILPLKLELCSTEIWNLVVKRLNGVPPISSTLMRNCSPTNICSRGEKSKNGKEKKNSRSLITIKQFIALNEQVIYKLQLIWFTWVLFCILPWIQPKRWS